MSSFRLASFLLVASALTASAGCRTAGVGDLARKDVLPKRDGDSAAELLVEHNRNAERVQSIQAEPRITVASRRTRAGVSGRLALERPRNFKLQISGPLNDVADIGSNDREFWFWVKDSQPRGVYYCNYDESGSSPLAAGFQPDWIVEALGLRAVPDDEAATIRVSPGPQPGTLLLTHQQKAAKGDSVVKETVLDETTHRILEHRVFAADHKTLLARAAVSDYQEWPIPADAGAAEGTVYLPRRFQLEWPQEKMKLDVVMGGVKVNPRFTQTRREALFIEPQVAGIARVNLAARTGVATGPTSVRESMPAPPPRVRLSEPTPLGTEGARRLSRDPTALAADLPPSYARAVEDVVGPPIPTVVDPLPEAVQARTGWRHSLSGPIER